jgi:choice-of-anchor C domain-containing protein
MRIHRALPSAVPWLVCCLAILLGTRWNGASLAGSDPAADPVDPEATAEAGRGFGQCRAGVVELLRNGGFERPHVRGRAYATLLGGDSIDAWLVVEGTVDHIVSHYWRPAEGRQSVDLDGSCGTGTIGQDVRVVPGRTYLLCFAVAANPDGPPAAKAMEVWWGDTRVDSVVVEATVATRRRMGWVWRQYAVTADAPLMSLRFRSRTPGCYGPALDDVKLVELPAP